MKKQLFASIAILSLLSCGESAENTTSTESSSTTTDTTATTEELDFSLKTLPGMEGVELMADAYVVDNVLAEIESEYNAGQTFRLIVSEDMELIIEIGFDKKGSEEAWKTDIHVENTATFEATLEIIDANHDEVKDELLILWNGFDSNNGVTSGYESENNGILIFDITQRTVMTNFIYSHHYFSYSAAEGANTDDPDYHAKMAEDSDVSVCSYFHNLSVKDGNIIVSDYEREVEGMGECPNMEIASGTFMFNVSTGLYELNNQ